MNLLVLFIVMNAFNVILQTVKSLCTVNCGKTIAAIVNAVTYGFYTVIVVYMSCELPLWEKAFIIGLCNLVGVYIVKFFEEKARKDKLWKVEMTVKKPYSANLVEKLTDFRISYNTIDTMDEKYTIFNIFCKTQKESQFVKEVAQYYNAKYFVTETKIL